MASELVTLRHVLSRLEANRIPCTVLALQGGTSIIVSQRGGRVFGPFLSPESESILWLNQAFSSAASLAGFLASGDWNLGGERIWIAPEIQYNVRDRADFWGSLRVPDQMDPGEHRLDQPEPGQCRLRQSLLLEAHNLASGTKQLYLERVIRPVEDPLRYLSDYRELAEGVVFAGYEQVVTLTEERLDAIMSETWNLLQLRPEGLLLIPASPGIEWTDYFAPVDEGHQSVHPHHVCVRITGKRQFKVGYKAAHLTGRLGYYSHLADGRAYLLVRNFYNDPSAPYVEEPPHLPGCRGDSVHVYNDSGMFGSFGELECQGQPIGGTTGRSSSTDQFALWLYAGSDDRIRQIALHLLAIDPHA